MLHCAPVSEQQHGDRSPMESDDERLRQLIRNSFDILVTIGADGIQQFVSDSCEKILGYRPDELMNTLVIETMIHPEDREKTMKGFREILENKGSGGTRYRHRHKNGGWVHLEAYGTNQLDNSAINAVVLNVRDITQQVAVEKALRDSEARLEELNAGKDKFFSIIAHDLKSPFQSIMGYSDLLIEQVQERNFEGIESIAEGIKYSARRTLELLSNLLEWSYSHTGRMKFTPVDFILGDMASEMQQLMSNPARQKRIFLHFDLPPQLHAYADKNMIATVLRNLIANGIKFTHPGGGIIVHACRISGSIKVTVSDTGIGMDEETAAKLFDIKKTFSTPGTLSEQGTGIGLLLCRDFIDQHNGQIGVDSEPGKGSAFWFTLPDKVE